MRILSVPTIQNTDITNLNEAVNQEIDFYTTFNFLLNSYLVKERKPQKPFRNIPVLFI